MTAMKAYFQTKPKHTSHTHNISPKPTPIYIKGVMSDFPINPINQCLFYVDLKIPTNNLDSNKIEFFLHSEIVVENIYPPKSLPQYNRCPSSDTLGVSAITIHDYVYQTRERTQL
ncbi:PRE C2HC domain-containing protein [Aphis craccivora]|uniref:PRE C2HC domain-containing protein n=1 Tax=Aphis craccivora TaxID=307492 RepID=A0A6G0ZJE3_APHCR|nr:PRE C2HC domain-containing protein [Aphis craccivora]